MFRSQRTPWRVFFSCVRATFPLALLVALRATPAAERTHALPPAEALAAFQLEPGLHVELVASEPLVVSPAAFAFDEKGRLYVVEARGYPDPIGGKPITTQGRIALLEDTDGDGVYDRRTEFVTGLSHPNGITVWRGGVFVTCAPDVFYFKDNDGDGVADERRVVLTGFDATKTAQLRASHPTLGLDGMMYLTCGLTSGKVSSPEHPERPVVSFSPSDGRFDPDTLNYETTGGRGQYGLTFDGFGRRFVCSNREPVLEVVLEPGQLRRNPNLAFADTMQAASKVESQAKVFPISGTTVTADFIPSLINAPHSGTFTSACSVLVFDGSALAAEHVGNVFICEPAQNLVQRQVFRGEGASLRCEPAHPGREFLASTDTWFRPVFLANGPDGALYVADMHRREIDHPVYVPEEARAKLDFESGKDCGRIYRIVRDGQRPTATRPQLTTEANLVAALESPDAWAREAGQRLLLERGARAAIPLLEKTAVHANRPESRTRALWTLRDLHALAPTALEQALHDAAPGVRENAVQLAGAALVESPALLIPIVAAARDDDPRVRFCAALALGDVTDARAVPALAAIALRDGEDRWTRAAVLSGIGGRMPNFLAAVQAARAESPKAFAAVMEELGRLLGAAGDPDACRQFLGPLLGDSGEIGWRFSAVLGLAEGLERASARMKDPAGRKTLATLAPVPGPLGAFFQAAATRAADETAPPAERAEAAALLGFASFDLAGDTLGRLLGAHSPPEVQLRAIRALERLGDPRGGLLLIAKKNWTQYTPAVREAVLVSLTAKPALADSLFRALRGGTIAVTEISPLRRNQLLKHPDAAVRQKAEEVFRQFEDGDRMQVYRANRDVLALKPDVAHGREVFVRVCSTCHTHRGIGGNVGPDLTGIRNQPADAILLHLIVPNYEVAPAYQALTVATQDGRSLTGRLAAETDTSVTLRTTFGSEETILRRDIAGLTASGVSLMPDGLERAMTKQEIADLIGFLKSTP
jgi:putative membrane-bound dehydrogenase-like protein